MRASIHRSCCHAAMLSRCHAHVETFPYGHASQLCGDSCVRAKNTCGCAHWLIRLLVTDRVADCSGHNKPCGVQSTSCHCIHRRYLYSVRRCSASTQWQPELPTWVQHRSCLRFRRHRLFSPSLHRPRTIAKAVSHVMPKPGCALWHQRHMIRWRPHCPMRLHPKRLVQAGVVLLPRLQS